MENHDDCHRYYIECVLNRERQNLTAAALYVLRTLDEVCQTYPEVSMWFRERQVFRGLWRNMEECLNFMMSQLQPVEGGRNPEEGERHPEERDWERNPVEGERHPEGRDWERNPEEGERHPEGRERNPVEGERHPEEGARNPEERNPELPSWQPVDHRFKK